MEVDFAESRDFQAAIRWNLITQWVNGLRKFGRRGPVGDEAFDRIEKGGGSCEKFDAHQITVALDPRAQVAHARIGDGGLAVEHQADRLDRFHRQGLVRLDEGALRRQVVDAHRIAGIEGSPEGSEDFEPDLCATITRRSHDHTHYLCKALTTVDLAFFIGKTLNWSLSIR